MSTKTFNFKAFAIRHDDIPAFHAAYLALTVLIASLMTLGAFAVLIAAHMALDVVKYREVHGMRWGLVIRGVVRESLLDIVLLIIGFTSIVYLHYGVGLAAASGLLRFQEAILSGTILLATKSKIFFDFLTVISALPTHLRKIQVHPKKPWSAFECFLFGVLGACSVLLIVLPPLIGYPMEIFARIIGAEIVPWRI